MPKFHFRLATLLKLRQAERDQRRRELSEALRADDVLQEQLRVVHAEEQWLKNQCRKAAGPGAVDVDCLLEAQRYEWTLRIQERRLTEQKAQLAEEIERRRAALVAADREVKILEKLRDHQAERHRQEENRRDIKQLDEIAQRRAVAVLGGRES
ncbi:MAG: flagellar export protein FliJ [Pirellulales bacterium]|nr:flagellar export protein FliJ [Pirellulales bacterium]